MISPKKFIDTLQYSGVDFFAGVPDSLLKNVCAYITDTFPAHRNIITANEGSAVAVAAGHYLATGNIPMVYMQNSGIGNAVNPLLSLADEKVYSIPMILMIGWRGEPGVHDEPQHVKQGEVTLTLLDAMQIPYVVLSSNEEEACDEAEKAVKECRKNGKPYALVIRKGTFASYELKSHQPSQYAVCREDALKCVVECVSPNSVIVSTTGKLSRELYEYREEEGRSHESDFLTVGSMGHSSSIALGIALARPDSNVICLDGDGAFIMHMGAITNIGHLKPRNYIHVIFNNGAHESVGGQPTLGFSLDIPAIATACGYRRVWSVSDEAGIVAAVSSAMIQDGPTLIEIKVGINSRKTLDVPRLLQSKTKWLS